MDRDSVSEGADADTKETGDAMTVDEAVVGYGKKQILAGLCLRVRIANQCKQSCMKDE